MLETAKNSWGYLAPALVFVIDNITALGAAVLILLQVIYQVYRIRLVRKECKDKGE